MTTDLTTTTPAGSLQLAPEQTEWSPRQLAVLEQIGVKDAPPGDLAVFLHVAQRVGLDPFARQIYLIGRPGYDGDQRVTKWTIQTGIDGYRLIARRAADAAGIKYSTSAPTWFAPDGSELRVWLAEGPPAAASITVVRDGQEFTAVALYREYVQTTRQGQPTRMWATRPAGQLAKCAEALALRMAFPQDLSGVHAEEEMDHLDNGRVIDGATGEQVPATAGGAARVRGALRRSNADEVVREADVPARTARRGTRASRPAPEPDDSGLDGVPARDFTGDDPRATREQVLAIRAGLDRLNVAPELHFGYLSDVIKREFTADNAGTLTEAEAHDVLSSIAFDTEQLAAQDAGS